MCACNALELPLPSTLLHPSTNTCLYYNTDIDVHMEKNKTVLPHAYATQNTHTHTYTQRETKQTSVRELSGKWVSRDKILLQDKQTMWSDSTALLQPLRPPPHTYTHTYIHIHTEVHTYLHMSMHTH